MRVKISRSASAKSPAEQALLLISRSIEKGELPVGSLLPSERNLAVQLGVSRVVVREVAKKLEQRGLVRIHDRVGISVFNNPSWPVQQSLSQLLPETSERLRQCAQARMLVEPEIAASAARKSSAADVARLSEIHERMQRQTGIEAAARDDIDFHDLIARIAGNQVLSLMLRSVSELGRLSRERTLGEYGTQRACGHHQKILSAISKNDPGAARRAMRNHLLAALGDLS